MNYVEELARFNAVISEKDTLIRELFRMLEFTRAVADHHLKTAEYWKERYEKACTVITKE